MIWKELAVTVKAPISVFAISLVLVLGWGTMTPAFSTAVRLVDSENGTKAKLLDGIPIDSIEFENRNIYDTHDQRYSAWYYGWANKLHIVSRRFVLRRELLFHVGEPFSQELAEEVTRNLRRRYPLNEAWIETERLSSGGLLVRIVTVDRWSLVGGAEVSRDGNETNYRFGLEERNFLGTNRFLLMEYSIYETEDNFLTARFRDLRLFGKPYSLRWDFSGKATDEVHSISLAKPFYNLNQKSAFSFSFNHGGGRRDVYDNSDLIAQSQRSENRLRVLLQQRWGGYRSKVGISLQYDYRDLGSRDEQIFDPSRSSLVDFADDSLFHQLSIGLNGDFPSFTKEKRINGFSYTEDFVLGGRASVSYARAFNSRFNDHFFDMVQTTVGFGKKVGHSIFLADAHGVVWFRAGSRIRQFSNLSVRYYNNRFNLLTIAFRTRYSSDWRNTGVNPLNIGGTNGLRGYDRFFQTGDRLLVSNLEGRFFPGVELLSTQIGWAAFLDVGRTYQVGQPIVLHHFNVSVGVGLRISLEKLDKSKLIRVDYALAQNHSWELSFSSGQYF